MYKHSYTFYEILIFIQMPAVNLPVKLLIAMRSLNRCDKESKVSDFKVAGEKKIIQTLITFFKHSVSLF